MKTVSFSLFVFSFSFLLSVFAYGQDFLVRPLSNTVSELTEKDLRINRGPALAGRVVLELTNPINVSIGKGFDLMSDGRTISIDTGNYDAYSFYLPTISNNYVYNLSTKYEFQQLIKVAYFIELSDKIKSLSLSNNIDGLIQLLSLPPDKVGEFKSFDQYIQSAEQEVIKHFFLMRSVERLRYFPLFPYGSKIGKTFSKLWFSAGADAMLGPDILNRADFKIGENIDASSISLQSANFYSLLGKTTLSIGINGIALRLTDSTLVTDVERNKTLLNILGVNKSGLSIDHTLPILRCVPIKQICIDLGMNFGGGYLGTFSKEIASNLHFDYQLHGGINTNWKKFPNLVLFGSAGNNHYFANVLNPDSESKIVNFDIYTLALGLKFDALAPFIRGNFSSRSPSQFVLGIQINPKYK